MGHYDDQRRAEEDRFQAIQDRDLLIEICRGDYDSLLAAAHTAKAPVIINPDVFARMLRMLKASGMSDESIATQANEFMRQRQASLIDRLQRERLQRDYGR